MFLIGLMVFTFSSLAIGIAQSATWLIVARPYKGSARQFSTCLPRAAYIEPQGRPRTDTRLGSLWYGCRYRDQHRSCVGRCRHEPISWQIAFFINALIGVVSLVATRRFISEAERHPDKPNLIGALLSISGMSTLVFGIAHTADLRGGS